MKKLIVISLLTLSISSYAQEADFVPMNKNDLYLSAGFGLSDLYLPLILSYERLISETEFENTRRQEFWFKNSIGHYAAWDYGGYLSAHAINYTFGKKASHIEAGLGFSLFYSGDFSGIYHYAAMGYRYQKPGKPFLFRLGWGWPEGLNISLGASF